MERSRRQIDRLVDIMRRLLDPGGCPWDQRQTHESLRPYLIEEAYEVLDAIDRGDLEALRDELGDLALQVVFHAELARRAGHFELEDVFRAISDKLVRRHPHVFGEEGAATPRDVERRWDELKRAEGRQSLCDGLSPTLPALRRGSRLGDRLSRVGFDWRTAEGPRAKLDEELAELDEALAAGSVDRVEAELGDVLFSVVNLARHLKIDPEDALRGTLRRFEARFRRLEAALRAEGREPADCDLEELERRWQDAKRELDDEARGGGKEAKRESSDERP